MQGLKHRHVISFFDHISGKRQSGRSGTDHRNLDAIRSSHFRHSNLPGFPFIIGSKTFQITDSNRIFFHFLQIETLGFALFFLRAYPPANGWQSTGLFQNGSRFQDFSSFNIFNKPGNIYTHRASFHTSRIHTILTTHSFTHSHFFRQSGIHFQALTLNPFLRSPFRHLHPFDRRTVLRLHSLPQCLTPLGITITHSTFPLMHEFLHFFCLSSFESTQTGQHLIKINLMCIEFRAIDTGKFRLSPDCHPASATHTSTIHHNCIQTGNRRYFVFLSQ